MEYLFRIGSTGNAPRTDFSLAIDDIVWENDVILGIQKTELTNVTLCPNPANETFFIKGVADIESLEIMNIQGQKATSIHSNLDTIDISTIRAGIYFVRVETNKAQKIIKFIKE